MTKTNSKVFLCWNILIYFCTALLFSISILGGGLSGEDSRKLFDDIVKSIKGQLPKALISWDISPWDDMNKWWSFFKDSKNIDFIHTSGGGHLADNVRIDPGNPITWEAMRKLTGKKIISDSGTFSCLLQFI